MDWGGNIINTRQSAVSKSVSSWSISVRLSEYLFSPRTSRKRPPSPFPLPDRLSEPAVSNSKPSMASSFKGQMIDRKLVLKLDGHQVYMSLTFEGATTLQDMVSSKSLYSATLYYTW